MEASATPSKLNWGSFEIWLRKSKRPPYLSFEHSFMISLDYLMWKKSRHIQFDWMCAAHPACPEYFVKY